MYAILRNPWDAGYSDYVPVLACVWVVFNVFLYFKNREMGLLHNIGLCCYVFSFKSARLVLKHKHHFDCNLSSV